ncbi:MAG: S8 family serine peptidase, partial [Pseudomonadota bacterium]
PSLKGARIKAIDVLQATPRNDQAHGTAMASLVVSRTTFQGAAPDVTLISVRAFDRGKLHKTTGSLTSDLVKAIEAAATQKAHIINMSFTGPDEPLVNDMTAAAHRKGIILVAAAGNKGPSSPPLFPAAYRHVIAVTAIDAKDRRYKKANRGDYIQAAAPGVEVLVAKAGGGYTLNSGTSVAAAYVSAIAALLVEEKPSLSPAALEALLTQTAHDLGPRGHDPDFGAGRADALAAIKALAS